MSNRLQVYSESTGKLRIITGVMEIIKASDDLTEKELKIKIVNYLKEKQDEIDILITNLD